MQVITIVTSDEMDLFIKDGIVIPEHEIDIAASRSGGPGGQHVNKTDSRITVRWNIRETASLTEEQRAIVMANLAARLTKAGELVIHNAESRSQQQNKINALNNLAHEIRKALQVPKKRKVTKVSLGAQEARLTAKSQRSLVKKMRAKKQYDG